MNCQHHGTSQHGYSDPPGYDRRSLRVLRTWTRSWRCALPDARRSRERLHPPVHNGPFRSSSECSLAPEKLNLLSIESKFRQNSLRVLPKQGRRMSHLLGRCAHLNRKAQRLDGSLDRMIDFHDHVASTRLLALQRLSVIIDRGRRDTRAKQSVGPILARTRGETFFDLLDECFPVAEPARIVQET